MNMNKLNFKHLLFFTFLALFDRDLISGQTAQFNEQGRSCSFTDETTGYSLIWHTNCTGYVNFVLSFRNFPATQNQVNYWIGVSFNLLSQELVLVEVINGFVTVQPARIYGNQPPQKNLMSPFLTSPSGTFFGASLEATFSIHESLLTGCKQWTFYTSPSRVGAPYQGQPLSKLVCNVAETCSRNNCMQNLLTNQYGQYGGANPNYFRPETTLFGNTVYSGQQRYNDPSSYYGQLGNGQQMGTGAYSQAYQNTYVGAAANNQFGAQHYDTAQYGSHYGSSPYGQYGGGQYSGGIQYGQSGAIQYPKTMASQFNQFTGNMPNQYGGAQYNPSFAYNAAMQSQPNSYGQQNYYQHRVAEQMLAPCTSLSQIFAQLDDVSHCIYGNSPFAAARVEKTKKNRRKRQTFNNNNNNNYPSQLQGSAYEGQDKKFVKTTPYFDSPYTPYYPPATGNKLLYDQFSPNHFGYPVQNTNNPNKWRFFDSGTNYTAMYYPYRTATNYVGDLQVEQPLGQTGLLL